MASNPDVLRVSGSVQGNFKCTWTIQSFSSLDSQLGREHKSGVFQLEEKGMEWYMTIYPGGSNEACKGHVSCFLFLKDAQKLKVNLNIWLRNTDGQLLFSDLSDEYVDFETGQGRYKTIDVNDEKFKLVNDTLVVIMEVSYCIICIEDRDSIFHSAELTPQENLIEDWRNLWKSKKNTDCIISVKGEDISAHSLVLSTRSKVFAAMFEHDTLEKSSRRVKITDFEKDTINYFMEFLYTGNVREMDFDIALELLRASDKYEVSHLKSYCENYLMSVLNSANVCLILASADMCNVGKLRNHAMEYVYKNLSEDDLEEQRPIFKDQPDLLWSLLKKYVKKRRMSKSNTSESE